MSFTYEWPRPAVTTDAAIFGLDPAGGRLQVLLVERAQEPGQGSWALPGGYLNASGPQADPTLEACARRELREETGLEPEYLEQLYTFGDAGRDPRGRVVTVVYWGLVRPGQVRGADDARQAAWFDVERPPDLAFDHTRVLALALRRLRSKLRWQPVGVWLLPEQFTLGELRRVYEAILGHAVHAGSFRRKIAQQVAREVLVGLDELRQPPAGRPAQLYRYDPVAYGRLREEGLDFEA